MSGDAHVVGVIGLGMASRPHARSLVELQARGRVRVKACWSRSAERRDAFADAWGLPTVAEAEAILDDPDIRTVLLITPPDARAAWLEALAARGKHVLMEKPVERTSVAARALVEHAERAGIRLGIVFQQRFRDASLALADRVRDGALGPLATVRVEVPWWREQAYYDEPGRGTLARDGGGVLISQAIHSLDLMLALAGPVDEVCATATTTPLHDMECEDAVGAGLRFSSGAVGSLFATTAAWPGGAETLHLAGTLGSATLAAGELRIDYRDGRTESIGESGGSGGGSDPMAFPHDWHLRIIEDFLDAVEADREPTVTGRGSLAVHALIDALLISSRERRHVRPEDCLA